MSTFYLHLFTFFLFSCIILLNTNKENMTVKFKVDKKGEKELQKFYDNAPRAYQRVSAGVLNTFALDNSKNMKQSIGRLMVIRNPQFVKNNVRFKLTSKSKPINKQESSSFSLSRPNFDGWEAVQGGETTNMTLFTHKGRVGDSQQGVSRKAARSEQAYTKPSDLGFSDRLSKKRIILYLQRISASPKRRRRTWYLPRWYKSMPPAIYKFVGGRVKKTGRGKQRTLINARIVMVSNPDQTARVHNKDWQGLADKQTTKPANVGKAFENNFNHELNKIKIK